MASTRTAPENDPGREPIPPGSTGNAPTGSDRGARSHIIPPRGSLAQAASASAEPPPDDIEALYYEGMAAYQRRHWEEALDRFTRLKELQPSRPGLDALLEEVSWFLQLQAAAPPVPAAPGQPDAEHGIEPSLRSPSRRPRGRTALYIVLAILALVGLLLVALSIWLPWPRAWQAEDLYAAGQKRLEVGDYEGAQAAFEKVLELSPGNSAARQGIEKAKEQRTLAEGYRAALADIAKEDWERAGAELAAILQVDANYADVPSRSEYVSTQLELATLYADGERLANEERWSEAQQKFEAIRQKDASYRSQLVNGFLVTCYLSQGEALINARDSDPDGLRAAVHYFEQAAGIQPGNRIAVDSQRRAQLYLDGLQALRSGKRDEAETLLTELVKDSPTFASGQASEDLYNLLVMLGQETFASGNRLKALEYFDRAQSLPVRDNIRAKQGAALARAPTPTPLPTRTSTPAPTAVLTPWALAQAGPVTARSGPGNGYPIAGTLNQGATVAITGRQEQGRWLRVCCLLNGKEAWAPSGLLQVGGPVELAEVVRMPTPTVAPSRAPRSTPTPKRTACVQGRVLDVAGGQGLPGWRVTLVTQSGIVRELTTDSSGFYLFSDVPEGITAVDLTVPSGWGPVSPPRSGGDPGPLCAVADFWVQKSSSDSKPIR